MSCSSGRRDTGIAVVPLEEDATELGLGTMMLAYGAGQDYPLRLNATVGVSPVVVAQTRTTQRVQTESNCLHLMVYVMFPHNHFL